MRPLVILTLLASLLLVSTASAKELAGATVCGADDCRTVGAGGELDRMLLEGSAAAAPEPAPFLRVSLRFRGEEDEIVIAESLLVPSAGVLGGEGEGGWMLLAPESLAGLERVAEGLEPWPASQLSAAVVELGGAPIEPEQAPPPAAEPPPPVDRSSPTGVVVGLGALVALFGLAAVVSTRRRGGGGAVAG
jgi:hypothetical protein